MSTITYSSANSGRLTESELTGEQCQAQIDEIRQITEEVHGHGADTLEGEINRLRTIISRIGAAVMEQS